MVMTRGRHSVPSRTETPDPRDAARRPAGKAYRPGLDGLRALAVTGVLLYHAGVRWMPGGLLGPRARGRVGGYAAGAACLSASWMAYIAIREGLPYGADSSRVYFGTDTHASGLLLGVAAAAFLATLSGPLWQRRPGRAARW